MGVKPADPKTQATKARVSLTPTRHCPVSVRSRRAKTSFPGPGTLRCAPCSFPPGSVPPASASLRAARGALLDCRAARNRRSAANRDGFRRTGPQGAARWSFNRGLPIPCRHADLRDLGRPANRIVWASRRNGTPRRDRYCFRKTKVEVNSLPSPFVPLVLVVIVLPSFETTMRLVA